MDTIVINFDIFFFFNDTATTEIYTLSLHDALPISGLEHRHHLGHHEHQQQRHDAEAHHRQHDGIEHRRQHLLADLLAARSEEHTSELQSQSNLVCRLLLEKKKTNTKTSVVTVYTIV